MKYNHRCKNCLNIYPSQIKKSVFCSRTCENQYSNNYNEDLSLRQKKRLLKKKHPYCSKCGYNTVSQILEVHHILPISHGGTNDFTNLMVICPNCHELLHFYMNLRFKVIKILFTFFLYKIVCFQTTEEQKEYHFNIQLFITLLSLT